MRIKGSAGKGIFPMPISPPFPFLFQPFYLLYLFLIVTTGKKGFVTGRDMQSTKKAGEMPESGVKTKKYANELYPQKTTQQSLEEQPKTTNKCQQRLSWKKWYNFFVVRKLN